MSADNKPGWGDDKPECAGDKPRKTVEQSGKVNIFFGNAAGVAGNHSYKLFFNNC